MESNYNKEREEMIQSHLLARGISDERVIEAFSKVDRKEFVLPRFERMAEREGFEPSVGLWAHDSLAVSSFRPLRHLSINSFQLYFIQLIYARIVYVPRHSCIIIRWYTKLNN